MNKQFVIFNFGKKKVSKNHSIDPEGNIISFETQLAIVSHYLHHKDTEYEVTYKEMAQRIIENWSKLLDD